MQRKIGFCILLVVFCVFCLFACQNIFQEPINIVDNIKSGKKQEVKIYQSKDMEICVKYGFCGLVQKDESLPIEVSIHTEKKWRGFIKILVPVSGDKEVSYEKRVVAKKGESTEKITIPSIETASYFKVYIEDDLENKLVMTKIQTGITQANKLYMGVLSEKEEQLAYFDGLKKQKGEKEAKVVQVKLETSEIPEDVEELSALDYLLINQFSASTLSKKQQKAIQAWVKQGGVLIVGMGGEQASTLDQLLSVVAKRESDKKEKVLLSLDLEGEKENIILDHMSIGIKDGFDYESLLDRELLKKVSYGKGFFCISEIDLSDPLIKKYQEQIGKLILEQITTERFNLIVKDKEAAIQSLWQALNFNHGNSMPNTLLYISLFVVYIGLIGPTAYFILKHFDRKTWFFSVVLILSCVFTALVFQVSSDYKRKKPITNFLVVIDSEKEDETIYMSSQNSKKKEYTLKLPSEINSVESIPDSNSLYEASDLYGFNEKEIECTIKKTNENFMIHFLEKPILEQNILKLTREKEKNIGRFQYSLSFNADSISGRLENQTKYDFSYVLFYYQKRYWILQDLKKNQVVQIENDDVNLLDLTKNEREYFFSETAYPVETQKQYLELGNDQRIFAFLYQNVLKEEDDDKGYFIGIMSEMEEAILEDENFDLKQKLVYIQPVSKEDVDGNTVMDILELYLQKIDGELYGGVLYSKSANLFYQFEAKEKVGELIRLSDYYDGKIYAYNYKKKKYDRILKNSHDRVTKEKVENYIDEEGKMRIQLKTEVDYTQIPVIAMTERE